MAVGPFEVDAARFLPKRAGFFYACQKLCHLTNQPILVIMAMSKKDHPMECELMKVLLVGSRSGARVVESRSTTAAVFAAHVAAMNTLGMFPEKFNAYPPVLVKPAPMPPVRGEGSVTYHLFDGLLELEFRQLVGLEDEPTTLFHPYADVEPDGQLSLTLVAQDGTITPIGQLVITHNVA